MLHKHANRFLLIIFLLVNCYSFAQEQKITISGTVYDPENKGTIPNLMVVNKRTQQGYFGDNSGYFSIEGVTTDTFIVAATGFQTMILSFKDSVYKESYQVKIPLKRLQVQLKPVEIFTRRELEEIQKDIESLGYKDEDYMVTGADALQSPITYLYQAFSRRERSKREVAELKNNDRRRSLLKELFRKYVDNDIIQLSNEEFDDFIDFCGVSDEFLQRSSQYEFVMYIKKKFEVYRMIRK